MKTKPTLFSTPMVQAINEGRKTQTRRTKGLEKYNVNPDWWRYDGKSLYDDQISCYHHYMEQLDIEFEPNEQYDRVKSKVKKGDILWVRETWSLAGWDFDYGDISIQYKDGKIITHDPVELTDGTLVRDWLIRKTDKMEEQDYLKQDPDDEERLMHVKTKWQTSIFMPKWACRLWLEVIDVRIERLQDISKEDAIAEGIKLLGRNGYNNPIYKNYPSKGAFENGFENPIQSFFTLWEYINGKPSLHANPWVWVYTFKQCEMPKDFLL